MIEILDTIYGKLAVNANENVQVPYLRLERRAVDHGDIEKYWNALDSIKKENKVVYDVGANVGLYSISIRNKVGPKGYIYSFEPQSHYYHLLCASVALNNAKNISPCNIAITDHQGSGASESVNYQESQDFGLVKFKSFEGGKIICNTLDNLPFPPPDFIKIDVEGMELAVLRGAYHILKTKRPVLWIEYIHTGESAITEQLKGFNYNIVRTTGQDILCTPA